MRGRVNGSFVVFSERRALVIRGSSRRCNLEGTTCHANQRSACRKFLSAELSGSAQLKKDPSKWQPS